MGRRVRLGWGASSSRTVTGVAAPFIVGFVVVGADPGSGIREYTKNTEAVGTKNIYIARSFYFRLSLCPFPLSSLLTLCSLLLCVPLLLFRLLLPSPSLT